MIPGPPPVDMRGCENTSRHTTRCMWPSPRRWTRPSWPLTARSLRRPGTAPESRSSA